nr:GNAT family N-acetyltransferase [Anaerolineae bacterium]
MTKTPANARIRVQPAPPLAHIRDFLYTDIFANAYAIGDLAPPYSKNAQWYAAYQSGKVIGVGLIYSGLIPPILFLAGKPAALEVLVHNTSLPESIAFSAPVNAKPTLESNLTVTGCKLMHRMCLLPEWFIPAEDKLAEEAYLLRLSREDSADILRLQQEASSHDERAFEDVAFAPDMVDNGCYYGLTINNRMVAIAGTHLTAPAAGIAAVGNVVVHPDHRGKRLGTLVSHTVTRVLLSEGYKLLALNVSQGNQPAIRTYTQLGFRITGDFIEGFARQL